MFTGLFRRYQRWIWLIVAILIIPPFIIFFSPTSRSRGEGGGGSLGTLAGKPITVTQFNDAQREAIFRGRFYANRWPSSGAQLDDYTYSQLLIIQQIREQGIHISPEAASRVALSFGVTDVDKFIELARRESRMKLNRADFIRFCEHEAGFRELQQLASLSGQLIQPRDLEADFKRQMEENVVEAAFFNYSDYTNNVAVTPLVVAQHYTNNQSNYRLPERIKVSYVEFPRSNYFAMAESFLPTNITALADEEFKRRGTNALIDPKNPSVTLTEKDAKARIQEELRNGGAGVAAYNKATEFTDKLISTYTNGITVQNFESFAASAGTPAKVTGEFSRQDSIKEFDLREGSESTIVSRLFDLTNQANAVLMAPIMGESAIFVAALKQRLPSALEPLESVRSRVTADYIKSQGRDAANRAGRSFLEATTNQANAGKLFFEIAAAQRVKIETLPPFSRSTETLPELRSRMELNTLKNAVSTLTNGGISRYLFNIDGGAVVHLKERRAVSDAVKKEKFASFAQEERFQQMQESLSHWFEKVQRDRLMRPGRQGPSGDSEGQGQSAP